VLLDNDDINAPASGFADDADKIAYLDGAIATPPVLPSGPASVAGFALTSAETAFALLKETPGSGPAPTVQLQVVAVQLGTGFFQTDRGVRPQPAWLFALRGVQDPAEVLAVSPAAFFTPHGAGNRPQVVGPATLASNGRTLTVSFPGAPAGTGPCDASYTMDIAESRTAVAVVVHALPHRDRASGAVACALPAYGRQLTTVLSRPLGQRVVVDAASAAAVRVTRAT
jgi:hypothetical protein